MILLVQSEGLLMMAKETKTSICGHCIPTVIAGFHASDGLSRAEERFSGSIIGGTHLRKAQTW